MKVVALDPHPSEVLAVVVEGRGEDCAITYYVCIEAGKGARAEGLAAIRMRVCDLVKTQAPDEVVYKPLENEALKPASKRNIQMSWFQTAEVRGVAAEAAHSAGFPVAARDAASVTRSLGGRAGRDYVADDAFWRDQVDGNLSNKKFRVAALMALSVLRGSQS